MNEPTPQRVNRAGRLTREEVARDEEIRRKVQDDLSPTPRAAKRAPESLSKALKHAIQASDRSVYQSAEEAGVSQIVITRFLSGERDIRMATADEIAGALRLQIVGQ